jgi:hypothetical protein
MAPPGAMLHEPSLVPRRANRPDATRPSARDVMGLVQSGSTDPLLPVVDDAARVDRRDAPLLLVVGARVPRGVATLCARQRGVAPLFAHDVTEAVALVRAVPIAACVVVPPSTRLDSCRVAATLRWHAPDVPVALVLGPGRVDDKPRIMWPLTVPLMRAARDAITDIAAQTCLDWTVPSWEEAAPTLDVTAGLADDQHEPQAVAAAATRAGGRARSGDLIDHDSDS